MSVSLRIHPGSALISDVTERTSGIPLVRAWRRLRLASRASGISGHVFLLAHRDLSRRHVVRGNGRCPTAPYEPELRPGRPRGQRQPGRRRDTSWASWSSLDFSARTVREGVLVHRGRAGGLMQGLRFSGIETVLKPALGLPPDIGVGAEHFAGDLHGLAADWALETVQPAA